MKNIMHTLIAFASLASAASAAQDTVKILLWDNDAGETAQEAPAAVMDRDYNSFYAWADNRDGNWNIYGRLWTRKPETAGNGFLVNKRSVDNATQGAPDVAGNTGEFVFVVWQDSLDNDPYWQIYGRKMRPSGEPMSDVFRVNQIVARNAKFPKVAVNPINQNFVVVWQDNRDGDWDVYARLFSADCSPMTGDEKICEDTNGKHQVLPVVCSSEKGIAIAWQDHRTDPRTSIYLRYMKSDLSPITSEKRISDNTEVMHLVPAIAASDTGFFTVVWINFTGNPYGNIAAQPFDPNAVPIGKNFQVNTSPSGVPCRIPSVTMGMDNVSFWTSWADSSNSDRYQIKARYYDKDGRFENVKTVNENPTYGQRAPSVCRFGDWFSVAWLDSSRTGGRGDIFGQYYSNADKAKDTLKTVDVNYGISADRSAGRKIWYHPKKNYDNPATAGWNEDPIPEPDSIYVPLDSAYVLALCERNIPNQMFFQVTDTDTLQYKWRKPGKLNSKDYDMCLLDLGYAEGGSSAGVIQPEQLDSLEVFAEDSLKCLLVAGNDFGEMYNTSTLFSYFGSKYVGPGNPATAGNIQKIEGIPGTFAEGMYFDYPYQQAPDNSVDIIDQMAPGSQLIMGSDPAKSKWIRGRGAIFSDYYKGGKASNHNNVYLTFSIGSLSNGIHPSTASELTRRILAYQGFNVEPEPIVDLVDSVYAVEGTVQLSWTAVSDDNQAEPASRYWLKYTKYNAGAGDLGKMSSEVDFLDTGATYYQTWTPLAPNVREKKTIYGFPPGDTLIFALKAGDESSPPRWSTLGTEPKIVVPGDSVTPHTVRLGYSYGCVKDFIKSEMIATRIGTVGSRDTLYTTWDASNLYLGYTRCDWRTAGDMFIYFDTRSGGADSTCPYNAGDSCSGFDPAFRPDFCLIIENGTTAYYKKATGSKTWVDTLAGTYPLANTHWSLDSINKYTYTEIAVPFSYLKYTVGNVFKYLVICNYETSEHSWNAFPPANTLGKDAKAPVAVYPYFYQINSLAAGISPRAAAVPLAVELAEFGCQGGRDGITLTWSTASETDHYQWLIDRSTEPGDGYRRIAAITGQGSSPAGHSYAYADTSVAPGTTYYYMLGDLDIAGQTTWHGPVSAVFWGQTIERISLLPARPNPASATTIISFELPKETLVMLNVYDICGRKVRTLVNSREQRGRHSMSWKGDDDNGRMLPAGVYFYQLKAEGMELTNKLVMIR